jgi:hypothetical protein
MTVKVVSIMSAETTFPLLADVQYMEPYGSAAFNRKLKNIIRPGFFEGFTPVPGNGLELIIRSDNSGGAASVDVNGLQITVQQNSDVSLLLPPGSTSIIVLEANYVHGVKTTQVDSSSSVPATQIIALTDDKLASNQIEVCRVNIPAGAQQIDESMIDQSHRVNRGIGIQLSSEINSDREDIAASSNAVKKLHDMILGIDIPDGSTEQPGLVQLSSATDSNAEDRAATPKAIKTVNDDLAKVKDTLKSASKADVVASLTDTTAGRVPVVGWQGLGGSARDATVAEETVASFWRDTVEVKSGITIPYDATPTTNYFAIDGDNHHAYIGRQRAGAGISWVKLYSEYNKPTPADIGALPLGGGRLTGTLEIYNGAPVIQLSESDTGKNYFIVADGSGFRINEDSTTGNALLSYAGASKRLVTVGQIAPGDWANFDSRYQPKGGYAAPNTASLAANGWWQCGSTGMIEQWCQSAATTGSTNITVTFPKAFPNACLHVDISTLNVNDNDNAEQAFELVSFTNASCVVKPNLSYGSKGNVAALIRATGR